MSSILMKLGMTRRTEAAVFAVRAKTDGSSSRPRPALRSAIAFDHWK